MLGKKEILRLKEVFYKINDKTFGEDDITELFRLLRNETEKESFLWEIASFHAHPEGRNMGLCHRYLNANYLKVKYFNTFKFDLTRIAKIEFNPFIDCIKIDFNNEILKEWNISKKECEERVKGSYELKNGIYELKDRNNLSFLIKLYNITVNKISSVDLIPNKDLKSELEKVFKKTFEMLNLPFNLQNILEENFTDIVLSIMSSLNSKPIIFYDGAIGMMKLSGNMNPYLNKPDKKYEWDLRLRGSIIFPNNSQFILHIMTFDSELLDRLEFDPSESKMKSFNIPNSVKAVRNQNGILKLQESFSAIPAQEKDPMRYWT